MTLEARQRADDAIELRDFVENILAPLHWIGPDGKILWANQAELDLLGYSRDEYIGRHIWEFHAEGRRSTTSWRACETTRLFATTKRDCATKTDRYGTCSSARACSGAIVSSYTRAV